MVTLFHMLTIPTLVSPFTYSYNSNDINRVINLIDFELSKISDWLAENKLSLNATKIKYIILYNYQNYLNQC